MEKVTAFKASEQEILDIINNHFGRSFDSIVALEELGNQVYVVDVRPVAYYMQSQADEITEKLEQNKSDSEFMFMVDTMLDMICDAGKLEPGSYLIDCRW